MSEMNFSDEVVLKVLSGLHQGAELVLTPGKYHVGSAEDNEVTLSDAAMAKNHFSIEVEKKRVILRLNDALWVDQKRYQAGSEFYASQNCAITLGEVQLSLLLPARIRDSLVAQVSPKISAQGSKLKERCLQVLGALVHGRMSRSAYFVCGAVLVSALGAMATSTPSYYSNNSPQNVARFAADLTRVEERELQLGSKGDAIVLSGYVSNKTQQERINRLVTESRLPKVYSHYYVVDDIKQRITEFIAEPGIKVQYQGNGVFSLSGQANSKNYSDNVRRLENDLRQIARIEHGQTTVIQSRTAAPAPKLSITIAGVRMTPTPHFITDDGSRYFVGGRTPDGREVIEITNEKIVFDHKGDQVAIYRLATGNQFKMGEL
jgi:type III secretion protein D